LKRGAEGSEKHLLRRRNQSVGTPPWRALEGKKNFHDDCEKGKTYREKEPDVVRAPRGLREKQQIVVQIGCEGVVQNGKRGGRLAEKPHREGTKMLPP